MQWHRGKTLIHNGITYNQIVPDGYDDNKCTWGYIDNTSTLIIPEKGRIGADTYITNSYMRGNFYIDKNVEITNSQLLQNFYIHSHCVIQNSNLVGAPVAHISILHSGCCINNRTYHLTGDYAPILFNNGQFIYLSQYGVDLLLTDDYCRVGCYTMTYEQAWRLLQHEKEYNAVVQKYYQEGALMCLPNVKNGLRQNCIEQLIRKGIKIEQGN